jgi:hypothetical protein
MSDDEKRDEAEVEGHLRPRGPELVEDKGDDTPDVEGHVKGRPAQQRPRPKRS